MNILTLCDSGDILKIFSYIKVVITIIKIVVPLILIVSMMIEGIRTVANKDVNVGDLLKKYNVKIVAALLIFFIPTFVNIIANSVSADTSEIAKCSQNSTKQGIQAAYVNEATKLVALAKKTLSRGDYNAARTRVNKLDDGASKTKLSKELDAILKEIEEKERKIEEERQRSQQGSDKGWWWPIGSKQTTTANGKTYATGTPSAVRITAYFGGNDSVHQGLGGGHGAIDIGASRMSNVIASKSGTVIHPTKSERIDYPEQAIRPDANGKYNCAGLKSNTVTIKHDDGIVTSYHHLYKNTITVRAGDHVDQGQVIGQSGSSGCSTGPHLHFQMEINGKRVDPLKYVSASNPRP